VAAVITFGEEPVPVPLMLAPLCPFHVPLGIVHRHLDVGRGRDRVEHQERFREPDLVRLDREVQLVVVLERGAAG
jgi:hypothetical protein